MEIIDIMSELQPGETDRETCNPYVIRWELSDGNERRIRLSPDNAMNLFLSIADTLGYDLEIIE